METQQPEIQSSPYQSPMYNYAGSIIMLTNPSDLLFQLEQDLRNVIYNENTKEYDPLGDPLLNNEGVSSVLSIVRSRVNQITIMSNLEEKNINALQELLADNLAQDLMINRVKYNIKNPSARTKIMDNTCAYAFICMRRAYNEGDRRFWKGSQQDIRTTVVGEREKKGLLNTLNPFSK